MTSGGGVACRHLVITTAAPAVDGSARGSLVRRRGWRVGRTEGADRSPGVSTPLEARTALSIAGETYPTHK